jgi:hypothetical protein
VVDLGDRGRVAVDDIDDGGDPPGIPARAAASGNIPRAFAVAARPPARPIAYATENEPRWRAAWLSQPLEWPSSRAGSDSR